RQILRKEIRCPGEFYIDADILRTQTVDLSETGIRLQTERPIQVMMRIQVDNKELERNASLVWARRTKDGKMEYGLEFSSDPDADKENKAF
ncbi:MAG: PilZ domain-containing protein, partial [Candidatus Riflebacteria bacterium]|nr:PilZ domain-containing protein [Candidatus Riflebacteria bacterium]